AAALIAATAAAIPAAPTAAAAQEPAAARDLTPSVTAAGRGEARVTPDRATVLLTVETRARTAAAAAAENARRQRSTLDALAKLGIARNFLGTAGYTVFPEQRYQENQPPVVVGYVARSSVRAEVRRIDQVGPVIDAALAAGSNAVGGVRFAASNIDAMRRSVLDSAVVNGCESAAAVARASGMATGELLDATVVDQGMPYPMAEADFGGVAMASARGAPTPINPGELTVTSTVSTRWRLVAAGAPGARPCRAR
ncbi:MAG: hypothetical protein AVDCRST_MAG11-3665, partial [uncultured Gemmatimonadaceae bacterium]